MKKCFLILMMVASASYAQSVRYPASSEWLNVQTTIINDGSSLITSIDIKNIHRDKNQSRYFWEKNYVNLIGTNMTNETMFTYIKVNCQKKIWTSIVLQRFKDTNLVEVKDSTNHSFPWNFFDFSKEADIRTYNIVCN